MKKILIILLLTIPFIGFGQKVINYTSNFLNFSYYDSYTEDNSAYYMDPSNKNVKLSCNSCDYGSLDNIMLNYVPIDVNEKVNMMELFNILKQDTESQMLKIGVISDFSLVKIGTESIKGIDIPYITINNIMKDMGTSYQKMYVYQSKKTYMIILSTGSKKDLDKRQGDVNLILRTLNVKK